MNIAQALQQGTQQLTATESPEIDCRYLLCHVLACNESYLHTWPDKTLTTQQQQAYQQLLSRRQQGEPVAYILGKKGFWNLDLTVTKATLIPRPDTEILVSAALTKIQSNMTIVDIGTGTGAIALALASERTDINIFASDLSLAALAVAKQNKQSNQLPQLQLWQGDWLTAIQKNSIDMIISNPPYIDETDQHLSQGDVRFEPQTALVAGQQGLADIEKITQQAINCLKPQGWLMIEHGYQQAKAVQTIFGQNDLERIETLQDYGGNDRVTIGQQSV